MAVCLLLPVGGSLAQGKSGKSNPQGSSVERSTESQKGSEQGRRSDEDAETQRAVREEAPRNEKAASSGEGFFTGVRRFFGFGRSEEASQGRVNENAQNREWARDQSGSPDDD
jgi:hypothetical protein